MKQEFRHSTLVSDGTAPEADISDSARDTVAAPTFVERASRLIDTSQLQVGEVVAGRFQIRMLAQIGGMGAIYRADDLLTGRPVAIKTMRPGATSAERFEREAERLSVLHHPGIPEFVASGWTASGQPYLAMEWLDGVDLATYLKSRRLGIQAAVGIVRAAAVAVAVAHEIGIVHRDLNPSNLFLVHGSTENLRVLDFGVARLMSEKDPVTVEGTRVGTPGYMAPEQVEGKDIGPQTDVFALGCVLYELLTGQRAFFAPTIGEVLSRILRDDPEPPSVWNGAIPPELDEVVLACLDKNAARRPEHAHELATLLDSLQELVDAPLTAAPPLSARTAGEPQIMAVLVLQDEPEGTFDRACQAALPHGLRPYRHDDGIIVLAATGSGTATDHATRAARCALSVQKATRARQISVSTGLAQADGPAPSGRAFDAARVSLFVSDQGEPSSGTAPRGPTIWLDESTATLLDSRFEVHRVDRGFVLFGVREAYEPARTVLGRKTRCVGRKRELSMLEATLSECIEEEVASAVLITGPPGIGKSRLAYELTRRTRRLKRPVEILRGTADPMSAASPFSMLIQAVHRACQIRENEPEVTRRRKLIERLTDRLPEKDLPRVAEFLGELIGTPISEIVSPELQAARRDAILRGDQILRAFEDFVRAECQRQPVLLILDDFHWGDLPTVKFVDAVLRNLAEYPFMVVALARPEVHEYFPKLWAQRGVTEVRLSGLSKRAATEMVHEIVGVGADPIVVNRVLHRAQGNPFWIEELLRAEDAGHGENVPDRVLLLAQSRVEQLHLDARRFLRAGSVFGRQFCQSAAKALLGHEALARPIDAVVRDLLEAEVIEERTIGRVPGEREFEFASGLLRDAAYSLLTEDEREHAHAEAAQWLEHNDTTEPLPVAIHYTLGGESDRARPYYVRGAEDALARHDLETALSAAEDGLSGGASAEQAVTLRLIQAEAYRYRGEYLAAARAARQALSKCDEGSVAFFRGLGEALSAAHALSDGRAFIESTQQLDVEATTDEALLEQRVALARAAHQAFSIELPTLGDRLLERAEEDLGRLHPDPRLLGHLHEARASALGATSELTRAIEAFDRAGEYFEDAGSARDSCRVRVRLGSLALEFGSVEESLAVLRDALGSAEKLGLSGIALYAKAELGRALGRVGCLDEAQEILEDAIAGLDRLKQSRVSALARLSLSEVHLGLGQIESALDDARQAMALLRPFPEHKRLAQIQLALVLVQLGRSKEALVEVRAAEPSGPNAAALPGRETRAALALAEALLDEGSRTEASNWLSREAKRLRDVAADFSPSERETFSNGTPERRRVFSLLRALEDGATPIAFAESLAPAPQFVRDTLPGARLHGAVRQVETALESGEIVRAELEMTAAYHDLGRDVARLVDRGNLNWLAYAAWSAYQTARAVEQNRTLDFMKRALDWDGTDAFAGPSLLRQTWLGRFVVRAGLFRSVSAALEGVLRDSVTDLSRSRGRVFASLGAHVARFIELLRTEPSEAEFKTFQASLPSDGAEGSEHLSAALEAWYFAGRTQDERERAQFMLVGNSHLVLHEQIALSEELRRREQTPLDERVIGRVRAAQSRFTRAWSVPLLRRALRGFWSHAELEWRTLLPRLLLNASLPEGRQLTERGDPSWPERVPPTLREVHRPEIAELLALEARVGLEPQSAAVATAEVLDAARSRASYVVRLYRSLQEDRELFQSPLPPEPRGY